MAKRTRMPTCRPAHPASRFVPAEPRLALLAYGRIYPRRAANALLSERLPQRSCQYTTICSACRAKAAAHTHHAFGMADHTVGSSNHPAWPLRAAAGPTSIRSTPSSALCWLRIAAQELCADCAAQSLYAGDGCKCGVLPAAHGVYPDQTLGTAKRWHAYGVLTDHAPQRVQSDLMTWSHAAAAGTHRSWPANVYSPWSPAVP